MLRVTEYFVKSLKVIQNDALELTESVMDKHTDRHTHTQTGKFIFGPCTALDIQIRG